MGEWFTPRELSVIRHGVIDSEFCGDANLADKIKKYTLFHNAAAMEEAVENGLGGDAVLGRGYSVGLYAHLRFNVELLKKLIGAGYRARCRRPGDMDTHLHICVRRNRMDHASLFSGIEGINEVWLMENKKGETAMDMALDKDLERTSGGRSRANWLRIILDAGVDPEKLQDESNNVLVGLFRN